MITGLGAVTPLGNDLETFWQALITGTSGVGPITAFDSTKLRTHIAGEVKNFDADKLIGRKEARNCAPRKPRRVARNEGAERRRCAS